MSTASGAKSLKDSASAPVSALSSMGGIDTAEIADTSASANTAPASDAASLIRSTRSEPKPLRSASSLISAAGRFARPDASSDEKREKSGRITTTSSARGIVTAFVCEGQQSGPCLVARHLP